MKSEKLRGKNDFKKKRGVESRYKSGENEICQQQKKGGERGARKMGGEE